MSSSGPVFRFVILPFFILVFGMGIFIQGKDVFRDLSVRLHWTRATGYLTQVLPYAKGAKGEYSYSAGTTTYSGVVFHGPVSRRSRRGDEIQIWFDSTEPARSTVPISLLSIPFLFLLLFLELACISLFLVSLKNPSLKKM